MPELTDVAFEEKLRSYLAQFSEGQEPVVPLLLNDDGTINREKTLDLVCYCGINTISEQRPPASSHNPATGS